MLFRTSLLISMTFIFLASSCEKTELPANYFESPIPSVRQTQRELLFGDFRDYQYCEVLATFKNGDELITEVYATLGCNKCPDDKWSQITADGLKAELGAEAIRLNGPRHWMLNKIRSSEGNIQYDKVASFGDIQMKLSAQISGEIIEIEYEENEVKRWTVYTFKEGNRVYRLVNPSGEKYIMQSYSRMIDNDQSVDDLAQLGSTLNLPDGWSFETEILDEDFVLTTEGQAFVIVDDLNNAYQKIVE
jgi:hypothetical protein